jgi:hypothetical protein
LRPITDVRSTSAYRLATVQKIVERFVTLCSVLLVLGLGGCTGSGCNGSPNPSSETCDGVARGKVTALEIGRDLGGGFEPYVDGQVVPLVTGGQGFPMLVVNLRATGEDLGGCLPQSTEVFIADQLSTSEGAPLVIRQTDTDEWVSGDALLIAFDAYSGVEARIESEAGGAMASVNVWVDYVAVDAGTL